MSYLNNRTECPCVSQNHDNVNEPRFTNKLTYAQEYNNVWLIKPQYRNQYNYKKNEGPIWFPGQSPFHSKKYFDNVMSYLSLDPTTYDNNGYRSYTYDDQPFVQCYGINSENSDPCAKGYKKVCRRIGFKTQCTCAKSGSCGQCSFGQGTVSGIWK